MGRLNPVANMLATTNNKPDHVAMVDKNASSVKLSLLLEHGSYLISAVQARSGLGSTVARELAEACAQVKRAGCGLRTLICSQASLLAG